MSNFTVESLPTPVLRDELAEECDVSVEHALMHIRSARSCPEDTEQVQHDLIIVDIILELLKRGRT